MRKFKFLILPFLLLIGSATVVRSQCTITDVAITNVVINSNVATFDLSFKHIRNGGNKWVTIHFWDLAHYPNFNYSSVPTAAQLGGLVPLGTIVINNDNVAATGNYTAAQAFNTTYQNDGTFVISTNNSSILNYNATTSTYSMTGLSLTLPPGISVLEADVWSSQANHNQQVHCFNKNIFPVVSGQLPALSGIRDCNTNTLVVNITNPNVINTTGSYIVYADANGNNVLDGTDVAIYNSSTVTLPANGSFSSSSISIPAIYKYRDLYVVLNANGFQLAVVSKISTCQIVTPVTGMETFTAVNNGDKTKFSWTSQTEINNNYYTIEKSYDGKEWFDVAMIDSKAPDGNSSMPIIYTFELSNLKINYAAFGLIALFLIGGLLLRRYVPMRVMLIAGLLVWMAPGCKKQTIADEQLLAKQTVEYRLKQTDRDGHYSYSLVRFVKQ